MKRILKTTLTVIMVLAMISGSLRTLTLSAEAADGTVLSAGDISIVGLNSDGDDEFAFLLLKDIASGTSLYITDKGWNDVTGFYTDEYGGDGIWKWTTADDLSAGSLVHIKTTNNGIIEAGSLAASTGTVSWVENNGTVISYTGDQIFLYQGEATSPTFITGIHWNVEAGTTDGNWDGVADSVKTSALPDQLTNGVNAIWVYESGPTERDNFRYKTTATASGTPSELRAAINNLSNWDVDTTGTSGETPYTLNPFPISFTVTPEAAAPTVTTDAAGGISVTGATLNGTVNANTLSSTVTFEYGLTTSYGSTVTATESPVTGTSDTSVSYPLTGLSANTTYHYRVKAINANGTTYGNDQTFTTNPITASITAAPALSEANLDGASVTVVLSGTTFADSTLEKTNFTPNNAPTGTSVDSITYDSPTQCTLHLTYDETDFDSDVTTFSLMIGAAELSSGSALTTNTLTITATVETLPTVTLGLSGSPVAENGATVTVTATLSNTSTSDVTVTLGYSGTATGGGTDYTASSTTITIASGNASGTATITAVSDTLDEDDETVIVDITGVTNGTEDGTQQVTATITDDDDSPSISVNDPSVTEGNSGTTTLSFTVSLSAASGKSITVNYATENGTATTADSDYTATSGTLTFNAGETSKTVNVTITGDTVTESAETVLLNLSAPTNATISDNQGSGTITDDDTHYSDEDTTDTGTQLSSNIATSSVGKVETGTNEAGQTVTTVTVDTNKLQEILSTKETGATLTILIPTGTEVAAGVLTGNMIYAMDQNDATLIIETERAAYTLPAKEIDIDALSKQFGENVDLSDITVTISIAEPSSDMIQVVENAASDGGYELLVPAVEFTISCTYGDKTVEVSSFDAYVERMIAIPDGVDPEKISTAVIIDAGTTRHVPTQLVQIDGQYYAVINSMTNSIYAVVRHSTEFTDVENHWAKDVINDMASRMVLNGVGNNCFEPERSITRAEFATTIVKALGLGPGTGETGFSDVKSDDWYCGYIKTASDYGIINGCDNGTFCPNDTITREQAMSIIERAMKITGLEVILSESETEQILEAFSDETTISDYARESIAVCLKSGIITGMSYNTVAPKDTVTRAQVAVMLQRLLQKSQLI